MARATTSAIGTSTAEIFLVVNSNAAASAPVPELQHHLDTYSLDGPDGLVFVNEHGHPWHRGNFNPAVRWRDAREQIGIPNLHLHDLRHTGNTLAAQSGASLRDLMTRMGPRLTRRCPDLSAQ